MAIPYFETMNKRLITQVFEKSDPYNTHPSEPNQWAMTLIHTNAPEAVGQERAWMNYFDRMNAFINDQMRDYTNAYNAAQAELEAHYLSEQESDMKLAEEYGMSLEDFQQWRDDG